MVWCRVFKIKVFTCDLECEYRKECDENINDIETIDQSQKIKKFFAK